MIEEWKPYFDSEIKCENNDIEVFFDNGILDLLVVSYGKKRRIHFEGIKAIRMIDEGLVQNVCYDDAQLEQYKNTGFQEVVYQVVHGSFSKDIACISNGISELLQLMHYVIITYDWNLDILATQAPTIT